MAALDRARLSRRQFALLGTQLAGATVAVLLGIPIIGFLLNPLFRRTPVTEVEVGDISSVPADTPTKFVVSFPAGDWTTAQTSAAVYIVKRSSGTKVFSNVCTHMNCPVHWEAPLNQFLCPCHGGLYDIDGNNIGGPPPKPLPQYIHRFEGSTLYIKNQFDESLP